MQTFQVGNDENNYLRGYEEEDTLLGQGGDDTLLGYGAEDSLSGGDGDDRITANVPFSTSTTDTNNLYGGFGNDTIFGDWGDDLIAGGSGFDRAWSTSRSDRDIFVVDDGYLGDGFVRIYDFDLDGNKYDRIETSLDYELVYDNLDGSGATDTIVKHLYSNDYLAVLIDVRLTANLADDYIEQVS